MTTNPNPALLLKRLSPLVYLVLSILLAQAADPVPPPLPAEAEGNFSGTVRETMNTAGYTYVQVDTGRQQVWAAATQFAVTKGDTVTVVGGMPMASFHSKTLNRDFDVVYFTGKIVVHSAGAMVATTAPVLPPGHPALSDQVRPALPPNHPALPGQPPPGTVGNLAGITKAEGGKTVQEIISGGAKLAGQLVKVRGKVVKYNAKVMGKNWLHLQDGSGSAGKDDNDLTITTTMPAKLGDTVLVTGHVAINRDFGAGYKYAVMLEDAQVTGE
jgi:hypothetical protein